jgi:hypothetical protein
MAPRASQEVLSLHQKLHGLCVDRLIDALGSASRLFDRQLRDKVWSATIGTEDLTSTAICLIGLHRAAIEPEQVKLALPSTMEALAGSVRHQGYAGGVGLVIWANAVWNALPFDGLMSRCGLSLASAAEFVAPLTTMETAWLLSGLIHEVERSGDAGARRAKEVVCAELLSRFQRERGIFAHSSARAPVSHRLRGHIANFADQIYSVQALSFLAITDKDKTALEAAQASASELVRLQGPLGQWWWHYDSRRGGVAQPFPVYSVHQHAMAPMALMSLAAAGGTDFRQAVDLSHRWISANELGVDLIDMSAGTIWRDIEPDEGSLGRVMRHSRSLAGLKAGEPAALKERLKVNFETRPYEWAWCLFAGAIASGQLRERHVV